VDRVILQSPPKLSMGDSPRRFCLSSFARVLKRKPHEIAETLARDLSLPCS